MLDALKMARCTRLVSRRRESPRAGYHGARTSFVPYPSEIERAVRKKMIPFRITEAAQLLVKRQRGASADKAAPAPLVRAISRSARTKCVYSPKSHYCKE